MLELGGNAACIVDEDADLAFAADRIIIGAFYQSGQSCISVQRIVAHEAVYEPLKSILIERVAGLKAGDPLKEDTFLGPMITEGDAGRIEQWVNEAVGAGAKVICGGVQRHLQSEMESRGIEVIWGVIGPAADALVALRDGTLRRDQFICRGRQRRHRGHGRGQVRDAGRMDFPGNRGPGGGEARPGGTGPMSPRGRGRNSGRGGRTDEKVTGRRGT